MASDRRETTDASARPVTERASPVPLQWQFRPCRRSFFPFSHDNILLLFYLTLRSRQNVAKKGDFANIFKKIFKKFEGSGNFFAAAPFKLRDNQKKLAANLSVSRKLFDCLLNSGIAVKAIPDSFD